jgi:hypothetical protein
VNMKEETLTTFAPVTSKNSDSGLPWRRNNASLSDTRIKKILVSKFRLIIHPRLQKQS